ncbi:MAG TPA: acyl-homoserine-lactone synthase [Gemmataceae bacterium]|nr:acyl-homoserine-lactone synthase [Gemmataceae bacterium]
MVTCGFSELSGTPLYPRYLEFRNQVFNQLLKYHHSGNPVYQLTAFDLSGSRSSEGNSAARAYGIEYDHYDIPKALHLAYVAPPSSRTASHAVTRRVYDGPVLGCIRFLPTDGPYMIRDAVEGGGWRNVELFDARLPASADIYEASRIAVSPDIADPAMRKTIVDNLVYANVEIGVRLGVHKMLGIMYDRVWNAVYVKRGVPIRYLSKPFHVDDGQAIIIGEIDTSPATLDELKRRFADQLADGTIRAAQIEPSTWMLHHHHVRKSGVLQPELIPDQPSTAAPQRPIELMQPAAL